MKKNISINLQGLIFHIEEDGYEVLQRYLQDVKAHFVTYRGHEEIVADLEGRIAEIFAARTSTTKQVITLEDVEAMIAKMGRVQDFQQEGALDDDDDVTDTASYGRPVSGAAYAAGAGATAGAAADTEPRRLYRDMANRKIAGVCAGLARYFSVNPLWVRLGFLFLFIGLPVIFNGLFDDDDGSGFGVFAVLSYVVLWIALPKRYDGVKEHEDATFKKLFRDVDNGKIGGVSAGLAAYFKVDVVLIRILFIVFVFAGGFSIPLYIILWILVPEAKTPGDKMRMRGDAVTLSSLDQSVRNNAYEAGFVGGSTNRPVGTFLEELARNLRPLVNTLGSIIRWVAAAFLIVMGFSLLIGLAVMAGVAMGLIPESNDIVLGDAPAFAVMAGVPWWMILCGFLAAGIPVLLLFLTGIGLIARRTMISRTVGLSLLGLWLLGIVGSVMGMVRISREFQEEGTYTVERNLGPLNYSTVLLRTRDIGNDSDRRPRMMLTATDSGSTFRLTEEYMAHGATEAAGAATARATMQYGASLRDSSLVLDSEFRYKTGAMYRGQDLDVTLRLPRDKRYRLSEDFAYLLDEDSFLNGRRPDNASKHLYRLRGNQLECLDCTPEEVSSEDEDNENFDIDVDNADGDTHISADLGEMEDFSTDPDTYGEGRRNFEESDFSKVVVNGAYRVVIRKAAQYRVTAAGREQRLRDMEVSVRGDELVVRPRSRNFFGKWDDDDQVLITVELPTLQAVELSGAVQAKAGGFQDLGTLRVEQNGASHFAFNGTCNTLSLDLAGACRSALTGEVNSLQIDGSGACHIMAANLKAQSADVRLTGVSKARVNVSTALEADVSGASEVEYLGDPTNIQIDDSGASKVRRAR